MTDDSLQDVFQKLRANGFNTLRLVLMTLTFKCEEPEVLAAYTSFGATILLQRVYMTLKLLVRMSSEYSTMPRKQVCL